MVRNKTWKTTNALRRSKLNNDECYFVPDVHVTDDFIVQGYVLSDHEPRK